MAEHLDWQNRLSISLALAKEQNKSILVDFYSPT